MDGESRPPLSTYTNSVENPKLLQLVFPFLTPNLVAVFACVSRSWKHVADSDSIWTDFCVRRWPSLAKSSLCRPDGKIGDAKSLFSRLNKPGVKEDFVCEDFEILLTFRYKDQIVHSACLPFKNELSFHPFPKFIQLGPFGSTDDTPLFKQFLLSVWGHPEVNQPLLSRRHFSRLVRKVGLLMDDIHGQLFVEVIVVKKEVGRICKVLQRTFDKDDELFGHNPIGHFDGRLTLRSQNFMPFASQGLNGWPYFADRDSISTTVCVYGRPVEDGADEVKLELYEYAFCINSFALIGHVTADGLDQLPFLPWT